MELKLYDTLTREKRVFTPLDPSNVRMYVCGPTVYDFAHIGNARPVIVFDVLFRLLRHRYGAAHVTYVRNITDVDDKINARAAEEYPGLSLNEAIRKVTETTDRQFHEDVAALGCLPPTVEPRATEHIAEMRALIERLVKSGNAYVEQDHVLFSVASMPDYGNLARRSLDEMIAGARVEVAPYKRAPMDFVLWKPSKAGEPAWPSPAGIKTLGRPGWHIECSAMSWKHLGEIFDIHGGGIDLVFPHHENEIAQSRCAFHTPIMANYWVHNGFLQVEGEKMAKSLGNFVTIRDLLHSNAFGSNHWHGYVLRLAMLMTHYRQPIDWTVERLVEARRTLKEWIDCAIGFDQFPEQVPTELISILSDDLNSPAALAFVHQLHHESRGRTNPPASIRLASALKWLGIWNGEYSNEIYGYGVKVGSGPADADVRPLIDARNAARKAKDFKKADSIRDELAKMNVVLKDSKDPATGELLTTWEYVP
jgi:cysteinyl-tRNA synthetase